MDSPRVANYPIDADALCISCYIIRIYSFHGQVKSSSLDVEAIGTASLSSVMLPCTIGGIYIQWLSDLEYNIFGLPKPDYVIFLDMPPAYSLKLRQQRNELKQGLTADIHEADQTYLQHAYENAIGIAKHQEWHTISCVADDKIRTIEDIHAEIVRTINE